MSTDATTVGRKRGPGNAVGAWHVPLPGDPSRWACKRWRRAGPYRTREDAGLDAVRRGDRVCRGCVDRSPGLATRVRREGRVAVVAVGR